MSGRTLERSAHTTTESTPVGRADHVDRIRLDHYFAAGRGRVVRVLAPAGYGKTSLVRRWVAADDRRICWIDVAHGDADPVTLFATIRRALLDVVDVPAPVPSPIPSTNPYADALQAALADSTGSTPFVLVLDDVHRLRSADANGMLDVVAETLPRSSSLIVVGRGHHDHGSVGRLRLTPGIVDVTVDDLALDTSETRRLLAALDVDASVDLAPTLDLLMGWPAGIRLAGSAMRQGIAAPSIADHEALVDYLRGEWLGSINTDDLTFLQGVACLERFNAAKCDEVLGRRGSRETLRRLHRDDLVVFGLDERAEWFRLHPLLSRWLAEDLRSTDPDRWHELHVAAARFWESDGNIDRAIEHLHTIGDLTRIEDLVIAYGGQYISGGQHATVGKWLAMFPPDHVRRSPGLCGLHCVHTLQQGDENRALQWQRLLRSAVEERGHPPDEPTTWWPSIVAAALDERPAHDLLPAVTTAIERVATGPWAGFARWVAGSLHYLDGSLDDARATLAAGEFEAELTGNLSVQANCVATAAVIDLGSGNVEDADLKSRLADRLLRACGGDLLSSTAIALATTAHLHARDGRRDEAARQLEIAHNALSAFRSTAPWLHIIAGIALVRTALLLGERQLSRQLLREIEHHARFELPRSSAAGGALAQLAELQRLADAALEPANSAMALTEAENRVLQLMPTNLSLADIAKRLFVSRNTVKTHAAAIYRKLGADNRSEAVDRAAAMSLLER